MIDLEKLYNDKFNHRDSYIHKLAAQTLDQAEEDVKKAIEDYSTLKQAYQFDYVFDEKEVFEVKKKLLTFQTQLQIQSVGAKTIRFTFIPKMYQTSLTNRSM